MCLKANKEGKFLSSTKGYHASKGYTNWKDVTCAFQKHQKSKCHREVIEVVIVLHFDIVLPVVCSHVMHIEFLSNLCSYQLFDIC